MTECNAQSMLFSNQGSKRVEADFSAGCLSSDASGALLLREADRHLGLVDALDKAIVDPRFRELIVHDQRVMLAQRIIGLAQGYEDLNDQQTLRNDPALQAAAGKTPAADEPMASPPTLCRLEKRLATADLWRMQSVLLDQAIAALGANGPPEQLIFDFDATDSPLHGQQQFRFFHGYYGGYCYLPLYVFCGRHLMVAYLRPSDSDAAMHARPILKLLVQRIRRTWPNVRIVFRGDCGFCRHKLMNWCDDNGVYYVIGIARNPVLEQKAQPWTVPASILFKCSGEKQRILGSFSHQPKTWKRPRRIIVKAEHLPDKKNPDGLANVRLIVTNMPGSPEELYDDSYCARGDAENRIKEQQLFLFGKRMSCQNFKSNQFRMLLSAAAYTLVHAVRRLALVGTDLEHAQADTIRNKLFKIAGRVKVSVRRLVVQLASSCPCQELFRLAAQRLMSLPSKLDATPWVVATG
jgi:hypothetical protein